MLTRAVVLVTAIAALLLAYAPLVNNQTALGAIAVLMAAGAAMTVAWPPLAKYAFFVVIGAGVIALRLGNTHPLGIAAALAAATLAGAVAASPKPQRILLTSAFVIIAANHRQADLVVLAWGGLVSASLVAATRLPGERARLTTASTTTSSSGPQATARRSLRSPIALLAVAALLSVVASTQLPQGDGDGSVGRYFGFHGALDTNVRRDLSDAVVMRVSSPRPDYWRGATYTRWNGRTWSGSSADLTSTAREITLDKPAVFDLAGTSSDLTPELDVQEFEIVDGVTDILFAAWQPVGVELIDTDLEGTVVLERATDGTLRISQRLDPATTYRVTSARVAADAETLRHNDPRRVALPPDVAPYAIDGVRTDRTAELARTITAGSTSSYDAVIALEAWMGANLEYSLDIPTVAAGGDAVDELLFEQRQGFCEQIGTSLVVMSRSLGIPARLAVGYVPEEFDHDTGQWIVRERSAHAWAEIWFPGVGWQGFDPTAQVPLAGDDATPEPPAAQAPWGAILFVAALLLAPAAVLLVQRRRRDGQPLAPETWASNVAARIESLATARGLVPDPSATLADRADALARTGLADDRIGELVRLVELAAFAERAPTPDEVAWTAQTLRELEALKDGDLASVP